MKPETVKEFWAYMQSQYHSNVVAKNDSAVMEAAAALLEALKIQDKETFLKRFTTTLGRTIYIPFEIGVENEYYSLWGQVRVCVHEHQHIEQGDRDGWVIFGGRYLTSTSYRANYEAEAYGCDMEMEFWVDNMSTQELVEFGNQRAEGLRNYGCKEEDIEQAKQVLSLRAALVAQGVVETRSSQRAIEWLEKEIAQRNKAP